MKKSKKESSWSATMLELNEKKERAKKLVGECGGMVVLPTSIGRMCIFYRQEDFESLIRLMATAVLGISKVHGKTQSQVLNAVYDRLVETEKTNVQVGV